MWWLPVETASGGARILAVRWFRRTDSPPRLGLYILGVFRVGLDPFSHFLDEHPKVVNLNRRNLVPTRLATALDVTQRRSRAASAINVVRMIRRSAARRR